MKVIIEGENEYQEDVRQYGTYCAPAPSLTMTLNYIPTKEKVRKLWNRHGRHRGDNYVATYISTYLVVSEDGKIIYQYYDGYKLWDCRDLTEYDCREISTSHDEIAKIRGEASYESGWDNFSTSRSLWAEAKRAEKINLIAKSALSFIFCKQQLSY
jgi:hypothetical protein